MKETHRNSLRVGGPRGEKSDRNKTRGTGCLSTPTTVTRDGEDRDTSRILRHPCTITRHLLHLVPKSFPRTDINRHPSRKVVTPPRPSFHAF